MFWTAAPEELFSFSHGMGQRVPESGTITLIKIFTVPGAGTTSGAAWRVPPAPTLCPVVQLQPTIHRVSDSLGPSL